MKLVIDWPHLSLFLPPRHQTKMTNPQNFYRNELSRALRENAFGLKSYQLCAPVIATDQSSLAQAYARVELLEGLIVYLRLTFVGYEVCFLFIVDSSSR